MAWNTPTTRSTNFLVTAAVWNSDVVDNPVALRGGAIAISGQGTANFVMTQNSAQLSASMDAEAKIFMEVFA